MKEFEGSEFGYGENLVGSRSRLNLCMTGRENRNLDFLEV